jgi:predicted dinucleotide-binding enzyme
MLPPRIAVLGAGHSGPVIARVALAAGYPVSIAASGDPENIDLITRVLAPGAEPRWAADAVAEAGIVVLALPLHRFMPQPPGLVAGAITQNSGIVAGAMPQTPGLVAAATTQTPGLVAGATTLDPGLMAGKIVVDAMNYWPAVDGVQQTFEDSQLGSSEIVQRRLARSTIVKTLNHIGYHELEEERRPPGSPDRRALGVASDDPRAAGVVAELIERIGYDAVRLGSLSEGRLLQPGGPVFGVALRRTEFENAIRAEAA